MKVKIVAEVGSNWEGNISKAERIIKEIKKAGANAVKFQMWNAEDLYSKDIPQYKNIKKSQLTFNKALKIKKICDKEKIEFFCSPFNTQSVEFLEKLKVKRYKVASWTAKMGHKFSKETVMAMSQTKKSIIISMGMGGNKQKLTKIFSKNRNLIYCYCISEYPLKFEKINWKEALRYDGFSDHTLGILAPIIFTILKKQKKTKKEIVIEKHVKLTNSKGPDANSSITTEELANLVDAIRKIEKTRI